jgi:hypothetical protein
MADEFEITDEMRAVIGKESPPWTYEVTTTSVRAFARGVGYTDPVYYDIEAAKKAGYRNLPVPPTYIGTPVFIPGKSDDTFSEPTEGMPALEHGLTNVLDGGTEIEYFDTICAGDTLSAVRSISNLEVKDTKSLGKMLILTIENVYRNQDGKKVAVLRQQALFY